MHDLLELDSVSSFDHISFPGVVPRSFLGPILISLLSKIPHELLRLFGASKIWSQFLCKWCPQSLPRPMPLSSTSIISNQIQSNWIHVFFLCFFPVVKSNSIEFFILIPTIFFVHTGRGILGICSLHAYYRFKEAVPGVGLQLRVILQGVGWPVYQV